MNTNTERYAKCVKCGQRKPYSEFGRDKNKDHGIQSYCKTCKNALGQRRREKNVSARLRHHISTRIRDQLGKHCPDRVTKDLEYYLGYRVRHLVKTLREDLKEREDKSLRQALNEGYHVDHIKPLSSFKVIAGENEGVDWDEFQRCWAINNLRAISADENLAKGARYDEVEDK